MKINYECEKRIELRIAWVDNDPLIHKVEVSADWYQMRVAALHAPGVESYESCTKVSQAMNQPRRKK